ncbi:MAG TPA: two-component sensor histidine kinase [Lachnoclostridium phytofermentans]|uniref:histidine kinase n=1 Tax=Lachnoclostridium phytofermentans TaxID=66219 RepID=A0A3D2X258_9FIRM|nr:ATP-binding protein [Lachnoclostridium sp.]HCL01066.1 two-component sensor histidine kinase [Lachnoclostridium phytofermentans]
MKKKSLKTQLSLAIALVVLITVAFISVLSNIFINEKFKDYIARQQKLQTEDIVSSLSQQYNKWTRTWNTDFIHTIGMYALYDGFIIKVYENDGTSVWDAEQHDMSLCTQVMADISKRMQKKYPRMNGEFTTKEYKLKQGSDDVGVVSISYFGPYFLSENDFKFLNALNTILVSIGSVSLMFAVYIGWMLARKISRPITKTVKMTTEIAEGNYEIRFTEHTGTKELDALVSSINNLASTLEKQEVIRKQLTSDVSHELRTPLTTIGTHIEAMIEGVWEPTTDRLTSCYEEINRITNLVKDLEQLSKVENDNLKLNITSVDISEVIETIKGNFETELYNKSLNVSVVGTAGTIPVDKERISQVIINLLSNAIKYTPDFGKIEITLEDYETSLVIQVKDNGIGIPEEELPFIFERFYRADKSRNRRTGGAGIGLAIVKSVVHAHGGKVEVSSKLETGTVFRVLLPRK